MSEDAPEAPTPAPRPEAAAPSQDSGAFAAPKEDLFPQLLRLKADFENYRKRTDREKPEYYRQGRADM
ncbi:MAG: nucleotide exchange factor GrpE, partial [Elusimicrobia bacterium]|nr:nucleotide exchange factor GrpE [Elusimicrobiota bacterium]